MSFTACSRLIACLILTLFIWLEQAGAQISGNSRAAELEQCVEPTALMRKSHMDFLKHQRDLTVHQGIRTRKHSLLECIACHAEKAANGEFIAINAQGQFCQGCHAAVAVSMDCFQCHAARPEPSAMSTNHVSITTADLDSAR